MPLSEQTPPFTEYRRLDERRIAQTLARLRARIAERFPGSGLSRVADELGTLGEETTTLVAYLRQPHWPIRIGQWGCRR